MKLNLIISICISFLNPLISVISATPEYPQRIYNYYGDSIDTEGKISFKCGDKMTDDSNSMQYKTMKIGKQCWMAENLNVGVLKISNLERPVHSDVSDNAIIEKYCYNNEPGKCDIYGGLYDWDEMMKYSDQEGTQGICPDGWHIPTETEFLKMIETLGGWENAGSTMSDGGTSGFSALMGGLRLSHGQFNHIMTAGSFWISKAASQTAAWYYYVLVDKVFYGNLNKTDGYSVRCIKNENDCRDLPSQAFAGRDILNPDSLTVYLNANSPAHGKGNWSIIRGGNGRFENQSDPETLFEGKMKKQYVLRWTNTAPCGTSSDDVNVSFATVKSVDCPEKITDVDGNVYPTVKLGSQCWMAENLNTGIYVEDMKNPDPHSNASDNGVIEKYCMRNDENNCSIFGALYDWDELMGYSDKEGARGICPEGWHVPTVGEWEILINYAGGPEIASNYLSEEGISGFNAIMAGYRISYGLFVHLNNRLGFATSSEFSRVSQWTFYKIYNDSNYYKGAFHKKDAYSVRCIKDE